MMGDAFLFLLFLESGVGEEKLEFCCYTHQSLAPCSSEPNAFQASVRVGGGTG